MGKSSYDEKASTSGDRKNKRRQERNKSRYETRKSVTVKYPKTNGNHCKTKGQTSKFLKITNAKQKRSKRKMSCLKTSRAAHQIAKLEDFFRFMVSSEHKTEHCE